MEVVKQLTLADSGNTISVKMGQSISLTLKNPGDGGFRLNDPQYNSGVLILTEHSHQNPTDGKLGNAGQDTWSFTAKAVGETRLEITARRGNSGANDISLFCNDVKVN